MDNFKIVVFIMAILISLTAVAHKRKLPFPLLLVTAGLIIGFIPQLPGLTLDPEVVFLILLPPLLYDAASKTSWHEFRTSIRPIATLAISLVFFTTVAVALAAHYLIPGFSWPLAFVLGAVVSPPDAVAASGIIKGLGLNKKVITILEGESLVNDASALIAYRYAILAVTTGTFVFWQAGLQFILVASAGILIGLATGYVFIYVHTKIENNEVVKTSLALLTPYVAYLAAEQVHVSGVLAVVSAGLVIAWRSPEVYSYQTRMRSRVVWDTLIFLMHGFIFILIGLQLPSILDGMGNYPLSKMLGYGLMISLVTIVVRMIWVFAGASWQKLFRIKGRYIEDEYGTDLQYNIWKNVLVVAWTGTRGVISLAAALAIPLTLENGDGFPKRHSIIFIAFVVIFVTLFIQGLSLPLIVRWLKIKPQVIAGEEEIELQLLIANSSLHFIEHELTGIADQTLLSQLKSKYKSQILQIEKQLESHNRSNTPDSGAVPIPANGLFESQLAISRYQRSLLLKLHKDGNFSDAVIRNAERNLDIDDLKLNRSPFPIKS